MSIIVNSTLEQICLHENRAIISGPFGSNISSKYFVDTGIPVIRGNNLSLNFDKFYDEGFVFVTKEKADELKCYAYRDDLIFTAAGTIGQVGLIPQNSQYEEYVISNKQIRARIDTKKIDLLYAYYWYSSPWIKSLLIRSNKGSTVPLLTLSEVKDLPIVYPEDIQEQSSIVSIIEAISKKIKFNIQINDNLLAMAYDIYMYSFYGKIPNGKLKDILVEADKSSVQVGEAKQSTGEYPFFTSGSAILKWDTPFVNGRNCFLNTGGNADVKIYVGEAAYSTDTWCISSNKNMSDYLYLLLISIKPELNQKFFQGTGLKHLQKPLLKERHIYIPDFEELQIFNEQVNPMFNVISENTRENQELIALRDWLLPMLMNGQATISN